MDESSNLPKMESEADYLTRRIVEELQTRIREKDLKTGDKLPSENEISREYMASRHVVRRALRQLELSGFVEATQGRGRFVKTPAMQMEFERKVQVPIQMPENSMVSLRQAVLTRAREDVAQELGVVDRAPVILIERMFGTDDTVYMLMRQYLLAERFPEFLTRFEAEARSSVSHTLALYGITDYEKVNMRVNARLPHSDEAELIGMPAHTPLFIIQSLNRDGEGVFEYTETRAASDRVEVRLDSATL